MGAGPGSIKVLCPGSQEGTGMGDSVVQLKWTEGLWDLGVSAGASSHGVLVREVQASGPPMVLLPHRLPPACEPPGPEAEGWADTDEEGALLFRSFCRRWILVWRFLSSLLANLRPQ